MSADTMTDKRLKFRTLAGQTIVCRVKNPAATLGDLLPRIAERAGIAGSCECLDERSTPWSLDTPLGDMPSDQAHPVVSDLTPA